LSFIIIIFKVPKNSRLKTTNLKLYFKTWSCDNLICISFKNYSVLLFRSWADLAFVWWIRLEAFFDILVHSSKKFPRVESERSLLTLFPPQKYPQAILGIEEKRPIDPFSWNNLSMKLNLVLQLTNVNC
jgi:hypothetical protein